MAERLAEGVLANHAKDGELAPAMVMIREGGDTACIVMPKVAQETGGMSGAMRVIGSLLVPLLDIRWIGVVSEGWALVQPTEEEARTIKGGDLEKRAASGEHVDTMLLVYVYDMIDPLLSYGLSYHVEERYARTDTPGLVEGGMADAAVYLAGWLAKVRPSMPKGEVTLDVIQTAINMLDEYLLGAMVPQ